MRGSVIIDGHKITVPVPSLFDTADLNRERFEGFKEGAKWVFDNLHLLSKEQSNEEYLLLREIESHDRAYGLKVHWPIFERLDALREPPAGSP